MLINFGGEKLVTQCMLCETVYVYGYLNRETDVQNVSYGVCVHCSELFEKWFIGMVRCSKIELIELAKRERAEALADDALKHSKDGLTH